ncbi:MAG: hypothetical protein CMK74_03870 [Pseudomonadales bacterium]|nr:hypothetical protein [Pseudomonadales bacterium]|tara:strand:+ start:696 stop:1202 length:507 start_codon:yes stop_codon:yes gene_type:complete
METFPKRMFMCLVRTTLRLRLVRLSARFAAKAGLSDKSAIMRAPDDLWAASLATWVVSNITASVEQRFYLMGYAGHLPSRTLRRFFAKTKAHRAWLSGVMGVYKDAHGNQSGVCEREWTFYRKSPQSKNTTSALTSLGQILLPWPRSCRPKGVIAGMDQGKATDDIPW